MQSILGILIIIIGIAVICAIIYQFASALIEKNAGKSQMMQNEEIALLKDLHDNLERMEKRIEALETILINKRD